MTKLQSVSLGSRPLYILQSTTKGFCPTKFTRTFSDLIYLQFFLMSFNTCSLLVIESTPPGGQLYNLRSRKRLQNVKNPISFTCFNIGHFPIFHIKMLCF
ncbi:unnamed protein product [Owenia fusiformis]|uniref:Uncharacterized protein n=1 Tax=Owenia fusiformis TaxID=6347 RepID=A0A8S4N1W4_OWEFU|nr:unnamed protein product [Owenia fusiformis]